jgi:hypothetical protein
MHAAGCSTLAGRCSSGDRWMVLRHTSGYSNTGLYATEEW